MKKILQYLFEHKTLPREMARQVLLDISTGRFNEHEVTAFITVYLMRSITIEELAGFREALLQLCLRVDTGGVNAIDIVGTGGDGKNTFNISTLSCFVVAGAGVKVAKHGNYGASSVSGASNLLEAVGYRFKTDAVAIRHELEACNICFLHAPLFHPALKAVAVIRRNLGIRSFFNLLGPLVNPANPSYQLIGVFNLETARVYNYLLQTSSHNYTIVHSLDGYDEISLTEDTRVITSGFERTMAPEQLGKRMVSPLDLQVASLDEAVKIFGKILKGEGSWAQNAVVLANAAMAIYGSHGHSDYESAYDQAVDSLESGRALSCFQKLISLQ